MARPYDLTHGARCAAFAEGHGKRLMRWQLDVLNDWGAVDGRMQFIHRRCGDSIPRQAGKSDDAVEWGAYLSAEVGYNVLYTAHNYDTTCEMLRRYRDIFGRRADDPAARHRRYNRMVLRSENSTAQEAIFFKSGGLICFSTRTKTAKLGFSFDVIIYDEAQDLTVEQMQAISATTSSGRNSNPQEIFLCTPHRPGSAGNVVGPMRDEAHGRPDDDLSWWEWGVDEVGDIADESRWHMVNPSLGDGGVANIESLRLNCRKFSRLGQEGVLAFAQEFLGYWLPEGGVEPVIARSEWDACAEPGASKEGVPTFAVKFSPDGARGCLAACYRREGKPPIAFVVDVRDLSGGIGWFVDTLASHWRGAAQVVVDGKSNAQTLDERLRAAGIGKRVLVRPSAADVIAACSSFANAVREGRIAHTGQKGLADSVCRCPKRKIGNDGGWGFESTESADATPAEACALAYWGAINSKRNPNRKAVIR